MRHHRDSSGREVMTRGGLVVRRTSGHTEDVLQVQDSAGNVLAFISADGVVSGDGGFQFPAFTTIQRNAIAQADRPTGVVIMNSDTDQLEMQIGTPAAPVWRSVGSLADEVNQAGPLASRPIPSAVPVGTVYFATDDLGGTLYRSNGSLWQKEAAPVLHAGQHAPGAADPIDYSRVHLVGTLAARPAASTSTNLFYFASDADGGTLYRSNGSAWVKIAAGLNDPRFSSRGTLAAIPPATTANTGAIYWAYDTQQLFISRGTAWEQIQTSPPIGTTFPPNPFPGMRASLLVQDDAIGSIPWDFVYRPDVDAGRPWLKLGGEPLRYLGPGDPGQPSGGYWIANNQTKYCFAPSNNTLSQAAGTRTVPLAGLWYWRATAAEMHGGQTYAPGVVLALNINGVDYTGSTGGLAGGDGGNVLTARVAVADGAPWHLRMVHYDSSGSDSVWVKAPEALLVPYRLAQQ
jgi:hypothetical protein